MKQLMDTAATSGGGASSTEPARPKVTPMSPEIIGVRRVAVTMETMQVADIEKETTWETVSITYADAPISVVAQLRKLRLAKEVGDDLKKIYGMKVRLLNGGSVRGLPVERCYEDFELFLPEVQ